jgi:hypothetical protein
MRERNTLLPFLLAVSGSLSCGAPPSTLKPAQGGAAIRLKPVGADVPADFVHRRVYVSVYSSIYLGLEPNELMVNLAATVSVRNVSAEHPLVLTHARYYDSAGKAVRDYVDTPSEVAPMATVEYVVKRDDTTGGPGANFVIEWAGHPTMDDPIVEAVMIGQSGHAGFSFISEGKAIQRPGAAVAKPASAPARPPIQSRPPRKPAKPAKATKPSTPPKPTPKPTGDRSNVRRPARPSPTPKVPARKGDTRKE